MDSTTGRRARVKRGHAIERGVIAGDVTFARAGGAGLPGSGKGAVMEQQFVGLDVSEAETAVCVVDSSRCRVVAGQVRVDPRGHQSNAQAQGTARRPHRPRDRLNVCLALAHPEDDGLASGLHRRPTRKVSTRLQVNKTDANDAFGLAQIVRTGWVSRSPRQERERPPHARTAYRESQAGGYAQGARQSAPRRAQSVWPHY